MNSPPAEDTSPYTSDSDVPLESAHGANQQIKVMAPSELMNYVSSRLPGGKRRMAGAPSNSGTGPGRDLKFRRREDTRKMGPSGGSGGREYGEGEKGTGRTRDYKDELLDAQLIDQLRASIGDPFDESILDKN